MSDGWIIVHRKLKKKAWFSDPDYLALWMHLLLSAAWEPREVMMNGSVVKLDRGQLIAGRRALSVNSGISESKVYRILKLFEREQQINIHKTNKYSIISITNYDSYQSNGQQSEHPANSRRTAGEQQANTKKQLKEVKEGKEDILEQRFQRFWSTYPKKKNKGTARKAWKKIKPSDELVDTMVAKIEQAKKSADWKKDGGQFIPYPATWLNAEGWEDEPEGLNNEPQRSREFPGV